MQTLFQAFSESVKQFGEKTALIDFSSGRRWTYDDVYREALTLAAGLQHHNLVQAGDRVGVLMSNQVAFVTAFFALQALGVVAIPLNYRLTPQEHAEILGNAGAVGLMSSAEFKDAVKPLLPKLSWFIQVEPLTECQDEVLCKQLSMVELTEGLPDTEPVCSDVKGNALATLIYTSGTTGRSKGVMLSHSNLLADAKANAMVIAATSEDVFVTASPLFHVFGLTNVMLTALLTGATVVLVRRFNPKSMLEAITSYRVSFLAAVPTMYQMMLTLLPDDQYNLSSLRVCHSGAAPMHVAVFEQVEALFGAPVQEGYGQSEASSIMTSNPIAGVRKPGSIGKPLPGLTVEVVDEAGEVVAPGEIGELRLKGNTVMMGYWNNPEATVRTIRDEWLYTSDMGYQDEDGYLFLSGRRDDLINVGGAKVYPQEVEEVLYRHPAVQSCAVKAEESDLYFQTVCAYVVPNSQIPVSTSELQQHCRSMLAEYKVPKAVYIVSEIPKGATGKILRHMLKPPVSSATGQG